MTVPTPLPQTSDPAFAERMRTLDDTLPDPETQLRAVLTDPTMTRRDRFAALYGVLHRLHREYRRDEYQALCKTFEPEFGSEPYFDTFRAIMERNSSRGVHGLVRALRASERASLVLSDRPGVLHQYASIAGDLADIQPSQRKAEIAKAIDRVDEAIRITPTANPNFHATRAQLLRASGDLSAALDEVDFALSLQGSSGRDAAKRISRFESMRTLIILEIRQKEFVESVKTAQIEMRQARSDQIQLLGILAAVIALITAGVGISGKMNSQQGISLMLVTTGAITVAFSALIASYGTAKIRRIIPTLIIGALLIGAGIWVQRT